MRGSGFAENRHCGAGRKDRRLALHARPGMLLLPAALYAAAAWGQVQLTTSVDKIVQVTTVDGETQTLLLDASRVRPGERLRYTIEFTNTSNEYIGPGIIVITNPIPEGAEYLEGTAAGDDTGILFSVDQGAGFGLPESLAVVEGGVRIAAAPRHYTTIQWTFGGILGPGESGMMGFDVQLREETPPDEPSADTKRTE